MGCAQYSTSEKFIIVIKIINITALSLSHSIFMDLLMERTKLLFDYEERSVGILLKQVDGNGDETEKYLRAFLFNFLVTAYISGPRIKFRGYR